mgnify:CR=1 FL=1
MAPRRDADVMAAFTTVETAGRAGHVDPDGGFTFTD